MKLNRLLGSPTGWLSVALALTIFLSSPNNAVDGASRRRQKSSSTTFPDDDSNHQRQHIRRAANLPSHHPMASARQQSPNLDMLDGNENNGEGEVKSYFERNNLKPPRLVSRAERLHKRQQQQQRRRDQEEEDVTGDFEDLGDDARYLQDTLFDNFSSTGSSAQSTNPQPTTTTTESEQTDLDDLGVIIQQSKLGLDYPTILRSDLIHKSNYDRHAYPWSYAWHAQPEGQRTGVPIEFSINFHRVFSVDVINPVLDLIVWLRIQWVDPRLTWNPEEYGNLTKTWFYIQDGGAGGETSEIWTPDIELWNLEEGLKESFDDAYAIVSNDGSIYWSRPGHLRPACKFYGLDNFPFDRLTCTMEFGSWVYSGKYLRPVKGGGGGYTIGGSETAGESYNEFSFIEDDDAVVCIEHVYPPYPASPEEDWPVLMYNVTIERSWQPYVRGYITMQVLLNIVGFSAFWLPPSCGERMGLSITAMLAAVAAEIVVAANLPQAAEYTWFQKFSMLSMSFAFVALLESVAVLYFYYKRSEDMVPWWFTQFRTWYVFRQMGKQGREMVHTIEKRTSNLVDETSDRLHKSVTGVRETISRRLSDSPYDPKYDDEDSFSENHGPTMSQKELSQKEFERYLNDDKGKEDEREENKDKDESLTGIPSWDESPKDPTTPQVSEPKDEAKEDGNALRESSKSIELDFSDRDVGVIDTSGHLSSSMMSRITFDADPLDNTRAPLQPTKRTGSRSCDDKPSQGNKRVNFSGVREEKFNTSEPKLRPSVLDRTRSEMMEMLREKESIVVARDADDFNNEEELENNKKWKNTSARIDDVARFWIPLSFFVALAIILAEASS